MDCITARVTAEEMVVTAATETTRQARGGLRPVDPGRDVGVIADLMAEAFARDLDERGRAVLREMRWMARLSPLVWWWAQADPAFRDSFSGFVWEEPSPLGKGLQVVGNVSLNQAPGDHRRRVICNVVVQAPYRGRGIARRLTEAAIAEARSLGAAGVVLQVYQDNPSALNLYTGLGFRETAGEITLRLQTARPVAIADSPGYKVRRWRPADGKAAYELAWQVTPPVQHWLAPVRRSVYQPGWWDRVYRGLTEMAAGRRTVRLVALERERLVATMALTAAFRSGEHQIQLLVDPDHAEKAAPALLSRGLKFLTAAPRAPIRTTVVTDQETLLALLRDYGFEEQRTLLTLRKDFD